MQFSLSCSQTVSLRQRIEQLMKLELSLQLKLVLEQLSRLIEKMLSGTATVVDVANVERTLSSLQEYERQDIVHEFVRRSTSETVWLSVAMLQFVSRFGVKDERFVLSDFAHHLKWKHESRIAAERDRDGFSQGFSLALRLVMRRPDWLGGKSGTPENLFDLFVSMPQVCGDPEKLVWVLGGGWAVELLTGEHLREHHDIDTVVVAKHPYYLDCDVVHTDDYFGVIGCTQRFLSERCVTWVNWTFEQQDFSVRVLCPEFLFLSKMLKAPRPQDWDDVQLLVERFSETWDLALMEKLIQRNTCEFTRKRELMRLLRSRDAKEICRVLQEQFV